MQRQTSESIASGAQVLTRELIRQPVKDAVREALREEALAVRSADDESGTRGDRGTDAGDDEYGSSDEDSGRSSLGRAVIGLLALVGVAMVIRRRRNRSTQSDLSSFDDGTGSDYGGSNSSGSDRATAESSSASNE